MKFILCEAGFISKFQDDQTFNEVNLNFRNYMEINSKEKELHSTFEQERTLQRNTPHKRTAVHFNTFRRESEHRRSGRMRTAHINQINKKQSSPRPALKKTATLCQLIHQKNANDDETIMKNLLTLSMLRKPVGKHREQSIGTITSLLNSPVLSHSSIVRELKCLMSNSNSHESYLISKGLATQAKALLYQRNEEGRDYRFRYEQLAHFIRKLEERCGNCDQLLSAYQLFAHSYVYPPSVQLMTMYIGVHLYSINNHYRRAQQICRKMLDLLVKLRMDLLIPIYLILMVKLKANQSQWKACLALLSRTLAAAWLHRLPDLEVWCYFEFSRSHFALGNYPDCEYFRSRSEMSVLEGTNSIFREMKEQELKNDIELIRTHNLYFNMDHSIVYQQLSKNPPRQKGNTALKAQVYAKVIADNCKIRHVKNLIGRLGEEVPHSVDQMPVPYAGNPQFLTHNSAIKNLNVHFRQKGDNKQFYTFQNSFKNILILREMARNLLMEMKWYTPIIDN